MYSADIGRTLTRTRCNQGYVSKSRATSFRQTHYRVQSVGDHAEQAAQPARALRGLRHHGQPLVAIVRGGSRVTGSQSDWQCAADGNQPKAINRCAPRQFGMLITCRRRCQPIQGIPVSSRELGVARSVFDAEWFVKQPLQKRTSSKRNRRRRNADNRLVQPCGYSWLVLVTMDDR